MHSITVSPFSCKSSIILIRLSLFNALSAVISMITFTKNSVQKPTITDQQTIHCPRAVFQTCHYNKSSAWLCAQKRIKADKYLDSQSICKAFQVSLA